MPFHILSPGMDMDGHPCGSAAMNDEKSIKGILIQKDKRYERVLIDWKTRKTPLQSIQPTYKENE